jgi:hypothetical protein
MYWRRTQGTLADRWAIADFYVTYVWIFDSCIGVWRGAEERGDGADGAGSSGGGLLTRIAT